MRVPKLQVFALATLFSLSAQLGCASTPRTAANGGDQAGAGAGAQTPVEDPLPVDPAVRVGTLENGLTYYIRKHNKPEQRAQLWLAVDAGSVLEDEDQLGLAHFVEHMAFNGTERFEKNTLIDFVERAGMDFGADLNAFTSFDETVYMLTVPTDDPKTVSTGMDILEDWSGALLFDPTEVDKERGVVTEEWRLGRGASQRAFDKQWPIFLAGSKYADRKPIGEKEILQNAPVETLERFYKEWYRPELMAVIVVGDVDLDQMEADIKERFGDLSNPEGARARDNVPVPLKEETRAAIVTDKEAQFTQVQWTIKGPLTPVGTESQYRAALVEQLFHGMLSSRFQEIGNTPESPYAFSFNFTTEMGRAVDLFEVVSFAKPGMVDKTLEVVTTEIERVRRHGFLASEFERQKAETMREYERAVLEKDTVDGRSYTFEILNHFLEGEAMPGREAELTMVQRFLPEITLEEVNAVAQEWTSRKDRVVMASGAARDKMPTKDELLAIVESATNKDIAAYEEAAVGDSLMAEAPKAGSITKEEHLDAIDTHVWTLSNGAKVVFKKTDFKNDQVMMRAISPGGTSLASDKEYWSANMADGIVSDAGLADFDQATMSKMMAGKVASVSPFVGELEEGLRGNASPNDLELMMQMVHLLFTAPRKDEKSFQAFKGQMETFVKNRDLNPQSVFFDELSAFSDNNHLRSKPLTPEVLATLDLDTAYDFYQDRFADAGDFTFVFVGSADVEAIKSLSQTYLASLPTTGRKEKWKDVGVTHPRGTKKLEVQKGQDPKSFVMINFHGKAKWSPEEADNLAQLSEVLDIRLREVLREDMGGVYGAFSFGSIDRRPKQRYDYTIGFGCAPENVEKLKKAVFDVIADVKKNGIGEDYLSKIKEIRRRELETDLKENRFWLNGLVEHFRHGTDANEFVNDKRKEIDRVSSKNVQAAAKKYLGKNRIEGVLMPEAGANK